MAWLSDGGPEGLQTGSGAPLNNKSYQIPLPILERYDYILCLETIESVCQPEPGTSFAHLRWMISELKRGVFPEGKACRWLGFIQGVMIERGLITVKEERDFTRPFFTKLD